MKHPPRHRRSLLGLAPVIGMICLVAAERMALAAPATINILDHGAVGDGTTLDTVAVQQAITVCAQQGGGTVLVPAGVYKIGPLQLQSHILMQLEAGAVLRASESLDDYRAGGRARALIWAEQCENIGICGRGTIDGRGTAFMHLDKPRINPGDFDPAYTRQGAEFMSPKFGTSDGPVTFDRRPPRLLRFDDCQNVLLSGVVLRDASVWTVHLDNCELAHLTGLKVLNNPLIPNNDGIHLTTCRSIHISDCELSCGDDAICVTSVESRDPGFCENVTVTNCTVSSRSAGIRVGYGRNTIRNCVFQNLVIRNSNRGIGLFVRQEGSIENVLFNNIVIQTRLHTGHWWGKGEPIHLSALPERTTDAPLGKIRNIAFTNIVADSEAGIVLWAAEPGQIEDVTFAQVRLQVRNGPLSESYGGNIDLRPSADPQRAIFKHDLAGVFCRGVDGLTLNQLDIRWSDDMPDYYVHAIWCEEASRVVIDGFRQFPVPCQMGVGRGTIRHDR